MCAPKKSEEQGRRRMVRLTIANGMRHLGRGRAIELTAMVHRGAQVGPRRSSACGIAPHPNTQCASAIVPSWSGCGITKGR